MSNHQGDFQPGDPLFSLPSPLPLVPHHHQSRMTFDPAMQGFLTEPCTGGKQRSQQAAQNVFILYIKREIQPFMHKANMPCNGTPQTHTPTHPPTSHPSLDQQLIVSITGIDFMTMCHP